jgi:hypothetical protein
MAMTDDIDFPRLTPANDRLPSPERLFRKPEDLADEQFDLLAAAWVEDALSDESLEEFEALLASFPDKRIRAESFRKVRLIPMNDIWEGKEKLIRKTPASVTIRRTVIITLSAAAAILAIIIFGPSILEQRPSETLQKLQESVVMSEAIIPASSPITVHLSEEATETRLGIQNKLQKEVRLQPEVVVEPDRVMPVKMAYHSSFPVLIASADVAHLIPLEMADLVPVTTLEEESNWILRSISFLASAITKETKIIDGYVIANACVKGINDLLGWDMELEQVRNEAGDLAKVNFNSSLLSFSSQMNKNLP